jgi:hypothetical protein
MTHTPETLRALPNDEGMAFECPDCYVGGPKFQEKIDAHADAWEAERKELLAILDVAIARGEKLGYMDEDYRRRFKQLSGREYEDE